MTDNETKESELIDYLNLLDEEINYVEDQIANKSATKPRVVGDIMIFDLASLVSEEEWKERLEELRQTKTTRLLELLQLQIKMINESKDITSMPAQDYYGI